MSIYKEEAPKTVETLSVDAAGLGQDKVECTIAE